TRRSTGGRLVPRNESAGPHERIHTRSPASKAMGSAARSQVPAELKPRFDNGLAASSRGWSAEGSTRSACATRSGVTTGLRRAEQPHPAQFGELALVSVEHEVPGISERR